MQLSIKIVIIFSAIVSIIFLSAVVSYLLSHREKIDTSDPSWRQHGKSFEMLHSGMTHYELCGSRDAPTIVLLHGGTIPLWGWDAQVSSLRDAGYSVLRYDQYGRGLSDRPSINYTREPYLQQLKELLDAVAVKRPVDLVAHCQGTVIAADYTVKYPDEVGKVVLSAPYNDIARYKTAISIGPRLTRIPVFGTWCMRVIIVPKLVERCRGYAQQCGMNAAYYDSLFRSQTLVKGFEWATISIFRGDITGDITSAYQQLGKTGVPVLIIWGDRDNNITRPIVEDVKAAISTNCRVEILKECGHQPNWEQPEWFNSTVLKFLNNSGEVL